MRLNRYLASCGLGSRRKMDSLILEGHVTVNGQVADNPGIRVASGDTVAVDGRTVAVAAAGAVYLLHKPAGYITTLSDPQGRPTISEFIKGLPGRLYPVGRLDRMTSGLLLLTDDGALCHRLTHPSFGVEKEYRILTDAPLTPERRHALERGVRLEEGITSPARVVREEEGGRRFHLVLHEGWNRQVRRMCLEVGMKVLRLSRVRYAFLTLEGVERGTLRSLTPGEIARLRKMVDL